MFTCLCACVPVCLCACVPVCLCLCACVQHKFPTRVRRFFSTLYEEAQAHGLTEGSLLLLRRLLKMTVFHRFIISAVAQPHRSKLTMVCVCVCLSVCACVCACLCVRMCMCVCPRITSTAKQRKAAVTTPSSSRFTGDA